LNLFDFLDFQTARLWRLSSIYERINNGLELNTVLNNGAMRDVKLI
jgi:hypothetical protein